MKILRFKEWSILPKTMFFSTAGAVFFLLITFTILNPFVEQQVLDQKKTGLKNTVDSVHSLLNFYFSQQASGAMTEAEAKKAAATAVKNLRYDGTSYFWINDMNARMIMHPIMPHYDGEDMSNFTDPDGKKLFTEFVKTVKASEMGFVYYSWPKPGSEIPQKKLSFVKGFDHWNWIVGTGVYLDDVERDLRKLHIYLFTGGVLLSLVSIVTAGLIGRRLRSRLGDVADGLKLISQGGIDSDSGARLNIGISDEIGELSHQFNELIDSMVTLSNFRKTIQEDESLQDVFYRMAEIFAALPGVEKVTIFDIQKSTNSMKVVYPVPFATEDLVCNEAILDNCNLCKARRTGHLIDSKNFPKVCLEFLASDEKNHVCFPFNVGEGTIAIAQFIFSKNGQLPKTFNYKRSIGKAKQFIKESLPVIEAKRLTASLRESSLVDSLTGLNNRRYLQECYSHVCAGSLRRKKSIGILMCDIDYFKQVNDTYGHDAGDEILQQASRIIQDNVRKADLVFRFGGEEFLVMLIDVDPEESIKVAEKIRTAFESREFIFGKGEKIRKTISIGVSEFPGDEETFWKVVKFADVALYSAKENGRNRATRFLPSMWLQSQY